MSLDPSVFEKLGAFYLGRNYDLAAKKAADTPLLYDSRDLTTHAVCVGMTGSGKTGLCLALLEEAALDNIPAIIIDPKGDLGNLLLTFPDLSPADFRPWINEEDALRKGMEPDAYAAAQADLWRNGLAGWGETPDRIRTLRQKTEMVIYTPGSSSGVPVSVLASFEPPTTDDPEAVSDRVQTTTASLLGLLQIDGDDANSRESILISALLNHEWSQGRGLGLATLIERIQHPPFTKVGVLDLETFYPAKERFKLVMALNNLLASPRFSVWQQGEPLDAGRFLYTPEGKPRLAIFSIAHLSDEERMFFVSLLLNEVLAWTRAQSGTTSLRAILYMDEIFGYLPPSANPPSKKPMLTLLKQARAQGVGVVLATQNPVDLDYKALSNAGTWFIGRLQTERDKARVLDGLQGAAAGGKFDRSGMESLLAGLGNRVFLMNNVHDDGPVVFETRWTMSYLRGPLTREQIKALTVKAPASETTPAPSAPVASGRPALPPSVPQVFVNFGSESGATYSPLVLGAATVRFKDAASGVDETRDVFLATRASDAVTGLDWSSAETLEITARDLGKQPVADASFEEADTSLSEAKNYAAWQKAFSQWLASNQTLPIYRCAELKLSAKPGESKAEFSARVNLAAREQRDEQIDALRRKYAPKTAALQTRITRAEAAVARQKEQATQAKMQTAISVGSTILGALLGRRALSATTLNKAATAARGVSRSMKEGSDVATAETSVEELRRQMADLDTDFAAETAAISAREPVVDSVEIRPTRGGVTVNLLALGWLAR